MYAAIFICENTQKTWIFYVYTKDESINVFQTWLPQVENESGCKIKAFQANGGVKFISIKLRKFCDKKKIVIKYTTPYLHKENILVERGWKTIVIMKDSLLIKSSLPKDFWVKPMETSNKLQGRLPTKSRSRGEPILEEA